MAVPSAVVAVTDTVRGEGAASTTGTDTFPSTAGLTHADAGCTETKSCTTGLTRYALPAESASVAPDCLDTLSTMVFVPLADAEPFTGTVIVNDVWPAAKDVLPDRDDSFYIPDLAVTVISSKDIGIIMVGEGSTQSMPRFLHGYLRIDPAEFYARVHPTWKLGIRFLWGPRPFFDYTFGRQYDWKLQRLSKNNGFYCDGELGAVDLGSALMSARRSATSSSVMST